MGIVCQRHVLICIRSGFVYPLSLLLAQSRSVKGGHITPVSSWLSFHSYGQATENESKMKPVCVASVCMYLMLSNGSFRVWNKKMTEGRY